VGWKSAAAISSSPWRRVVVVVAAAVVASQETGEVGTSTPCLILSACSFCNITVSQKTQAASHLSSPSSIAFTNGEGEVRPHHCDQGLALLMPSGTLC
jgi:hypothetical protein